MSDREKHIVEMENDLYRYFVLKNGSRITSYRIAKACVGDNIEEYIKTALLIYPEGSEIYPISLEEHLDIQRINRERRRIFRRIRLRNTKITDFKECKDE